MNVLLVNPPGWQKHSYNLGLAYVAGSLQANGFGVLILDLNNHSYSDDKLKRIIEEFDPGIVGLSIKTATANTASDLFRKLKEMFPGLKYVAGGPHVTLCGNEFMRENKEVDFGIIGEGEHTFVDLAKNVNRDEDLRKLPGLYVRENGNVIRNDPVGFPDLKTLPFPTFDHVRDMSFTDFMYPLLTSRGCPYGCTFCCVGLISGKKWRMRTPDDVIGELLTAKKKYQILSFEVMDDNFTLDMERAKEICRLLIRKKLNLRWWCHNGLRADRLDKELLKLMKKAGCESIALGIESGDENVFANINKGETLSDITNAVQMIKEAGIKCVGYFIVGLPGDSVESTKKSVKFQRSLGLCDYKYNMLIPYPGTKMWDHIQENGRLLVDIRGIYHFGDEVKVPFETGRMSEGLLEQCYRLTDRQGWADDEEELAKIQERFFARYNRRIKRVLYLSNGREEAENIEIVYQAAGAITINQQFVHNAEPEKFVLEKTAGGYFDALCRLAHEEDYKVLFDLSKRKLFLQKVDKSQTAYVRGEELPPLCEWDGSAKRYFATRLKYHSPDTCLPQNGIIYKDSVALPFSHAPQWEKVACGKIESGLAFISLAACDEKAAYSADYVTAKTESEPKEIWIEEESGSFLEEILREADVLFVPEWLHYLALILSEARLNAIYYPDGKRPDRLKYDVFDLDTANKRFYIRRKIREGVLEVKHNGGGIFEPTTAVLAKSLKGVGLWSQIGMLSAKRHIRGAISHIVRF